jgi:hypothetical protein
MVEINSVYYFQLVYSGVVKPFVSEIILAEAKLGKPHFKIKSVNKRDK